MLVKTMAMSATTVHGRGQLGRLPTTQAPRERGAQRRPRERSERGPARRSLTRLQDIGWPWAFRADFGADRDFIQ